MHALWLAFLNSWRGLVHGARTERAVRLELVLLVVGVPAALVLGASLWVRVALMATLLLMLAAEFLNTAIEKLCDHLHPGRHPRIGTVKDLASAGTFSAQAIAALVWVAALIDRL
ncbi:diacylglycerol kinase [Methylobacterium sp. E-041]|jgi:diacylglycerol kinase (ATP)|uniref:diacylglycerol kinase n=1 Tax=unclassified Methylobacterium TaxID=2615210 RepID=UPI0011CA4964|nr:MULTISPECIES: diacylglycerol kinase [unclassified Methylobacterium]MCJ2008717.1 diacylglycerol kinase [Methylobacterium sp. J-092]MCJ2074842.1 diacylglycerol kinase [Methylobacterium sp. E-016]MCJ2105272.1 diacylglycerol kinase [Methylobacterium sp. E-041]MCJ2110165.1 diacylglycerol kinase [Methylobacterium sp. E-025]TXM91385.1 diacylglycerol kinase [Methylobacterium sp. WL116]